MAKMNRGRYDYDKFVESIRDRFAEKFPDSVPKDFVIDHVVRYYWKFIEDELIEAGEVKVYGVGKFQLRDKYVSKNTFGKKPEAIVEGESKTYLQYYPKFSFASNYKMRLRKRLGTNTEAERKVLEEKENFIRGVWEKRKEYMLKEKGKLPDSIIKKSKELGLIAEDDS